VPGRPSILVCAPRLGCADGVSIEAAKWSWAFETLGCEVRTLAGAGVADQLLPGLASDAPSPPRRDELAEALAGADVVVVENLCSLPLNPAASAAVASALRGRPAILHHHDLASQRPALAHLFPPPDDPCWLHVTINEISAAELGSAGIAARVVRNRFDPDPPPGRRDLVRDALGVTEGDRLLLHPVRAIPRKNIPLALAISEEAAAVYWLLGPAEDGYGPELERLLAATRARVVRGWPRLAGPPAGGRPAGAPGPDIHDAYAACDGVLLPSTWEGFGNPAVESATHDRPLLIGDYPVAGELRRLGFRWFHAGPGGAEGGARRPRRGATGAAGGEFGRDNGSEEDDVKAFCRVLDCPDPELMAHNHAVARHELALAGLPAALQPMLDAVLASPVRSW
jgi:glycosyltransferase involved in cell wall biosynthesis